MAQTEIQEILLKHKKKLIYCESDQRVEQVTQRGSVVFILGDIQNSAGHGPEQPALADPAFEQGFGSDDLQRCLPTSTIL